jgi:hypothetical protein
MIKWDEKTTDTRMKNLISDAKRVEKKMFSDLAKVLHCTQDAIRIEYRRRRGFQMDGNKYYKV